MTLAYLTWRSLLAVTLVIIGTICAEKCTRLHNRPIIIGLLFGLCGIIATCCLTEDVPGLNITIGVQDTAAIAAAFFFHPLAGLIAGGISAIFRLIPVFWHVSVAEWLTSAVSTLFVAGYAAASTQWIFDRKRPPVIVAGVAAAFGEILHLLVMYFPHMLLYLHIQSTLDISDTAFVDAEQHIAEMLEYQWAAVSPMTLCAFLTAGICAYICGSRYSLKENLHYSMSISFAVFGIALGAIIVEETLDAELTTENNLWAASRELVNRLNERETYMMQHLAIDLLDDITPETTQEELITLAQRADMDEINIFTPNGRLLVSNCDKSAQRFTALGNKTVSLLKNGIKDIVSTNFPWEIPHKEAEGFVKHVTIAMPNGYFLQLGYTWEHMISDALPMYISFLESTSFGEWGFLLITDKNGKILGDIKGHPGLKGESINTIGLDNNITQWDNYQTFDARIFNIWYKCVRYEDLGEICSYGAIPLAERYGSAINTIVVAGLILFALCIFFRFTTLRIYRVQRQIDEIRKQDMDLAATIQNSELRKDGIENESIRICASMAPAKEVGGDFYDYYSLPDGSIVITIADVSGKGVPAAFFMMKAKNELKDAISSGVPLGDAMKNANKALNKNNQAFMFVTAWIGIFDLNKGTVRYVCAGHNPPVIRRKDGTVEWIRSTAKGKPLAAFAKSKYQEEHISLQPGDIFYLYTDGVTEAMNTQGELYGTARLEKVLKHPAQIQDISDDLKHFTGEAPRTDDITILTLEIKQL